MQRKKLLSTILSLSLIGGAGLSTSYLINRQREQEQQRIKQVQSNYIFDPSCIHEQSRVAVNYNGRYERSLLNRVIDKLAEITTNSEHTERYYAVRNKIIPEYSEGVVVGITRNSRDNEINSVYVNFPNISKKMMPAKYQNTWFAKDHSQDARSKRGLDLISIADFPVKEGVVARYDPNELLVKKP